MSFENQYSAPASKLDQPGNEDFGEIKVFSIKGRLGRVRYIAYSLGFYFLFSIVMAFAGGLGAAAGQVGFSIISLVSWLAMLVIIYMLTIQRCHDFNTTGWLALVSLIPLVGLIFWFIPGTDGPNKYGAPLPPNGKSIIVVIALILIPIIGILAAIAVPAYQDYIQRAQEAQIEQTQ